MVRMVIPPRMIGETARTTADGNVYTRMTRRINSPAYATPQTAVITRLTKRKYGYCQSPLYCAILAGSLAVAKERLKENMSGLGNSSETKQVITSAPVKNDYLMSRSLGSRPRKEA